MNIDYTCTASNSEVVGLIDRLLALVSDSSTTLLELQEALVEAQDMLTCLSG